jgi:hypothetical protein
MPLNSVNTPGNHHSSWVTNGVHCLCFCVVCWCAVPCARRCATAFASILPGCITHELQKACTISKVMMTRSSKVRSGTHITVNELIAHPLFVCCWSVSHRVPACVDALLHVQLRLLASSSGSRCAGGWNGGPMCMQGVLPRYCMVFQSRSDESMLPGCFSSTMGGFRAGERCLHGCLQQCVLDLSSLCMAPSAMRRRVLARCTSSGLRCGCSMREAQVSAVHAECLASVCFHTVSTC